MDRMTYREAVDGQSGGSPVFFPGQDFDPYNEDEVAVVRLASQTHEADRIRELERQVATLRHELAEARGEADEDVEAGEFAPEPWKMTDGLDMPGYES